MTTLLSPVPDPVDPALARQAVRCAQRVLGLRQPTPELPDVRPLSSLRTGAPPKVVLAFGLGADSSAVLARWLTDPSSRDFDLDELVVVTGMTGQEWPVTRRLVQRHLLPLMAAHRVRYVQVARRGPVQADGIDVLADSHTPDRLRLVGAWTLAHEMLDAGTLPQTGGNRLCSAHFKAWPLDTTIAALTRGRPYRHVMGYESNETRRAERDAGYNTALRTGEYPLREWGWDRAACQAFLRETFGVRAWAKSACTYCPFALATAAGKAETLARFVAEPEAGVLALAMEFTATALNPTQGLIRGQRLLTLLRDSDGTTGVLELFERRLAQLPWAVYDVRRTLTPRADGRANHTRSLRILDIGTREDAQARLSLRSRAANVQTVTGAAEFPDDEHRRAWLRRRDPAVLAAGMTTAEQFLTCAPATALNKTGPAFATAWAAAAQLDLLTA